jgi:thiamine biosynthesis lipoprotein
MSAIEVREGRALGSRLRLTVARPGGRAPIDAEVDAGWAAVEVVFGEVDRAMSRFRDDSELTLLNRRLRAPAARLVPSRMLAAALSLADRACRVTAGRFDARIVGDLERLGASGVSQGASGRRASPSGALVHRAGRHAPLQLLAPADLGGIGKGLALRWAARSVAALLGATPFLLDAGGDITSRGVPGAVPDARGWSIGIEDPAPSADGAEPIATVELWPDQSIATSSVRIGRWAGPGGRAVHHLIDPRTGQPGGDGLRAVTVAWPDPAWAEVWSKALFLEGARGIAGMARGRGLAAWWIDDAGELSMTPAARLQTTWVRAEAESSAA